MEELRLLLEFTSGNNISKSDKIQKSRRANALYDVMKKNPDIEINDAMVIVYNNKYSLSSKYKLIALLKDLLLDSIQKFDYEKKIDSNYYEIKIRAYQNWSTINILYINHQPDIALILAKRTLKTALEYEFTDIIVLVSRLILAYYQKFIGGDKEFKCYSKIFKENLVFQQQENDLELWYAEIASLYKNSKGGNIDILLSKLRKYCLILEEYQKSNKYFKFNIKTYIMLSTLYILEHKYLKAISNTKKAIAFIDSKPFRTKNSKRPFVNDVIIANIMLGNHMELNKLIRENIEITKWGTSNYFNITSYQFTHNIVSKNYNQLPDICIEAISHKTIKNNKYKNEIWQIRMAYLYFLYSIGLLKTDNKKIVDFRVRKMLNDVPVFTKDKKGMHNSIKIIEILLLILSDKYDTVIDKYDSLRVYSNTYLKGKRSYRNRLFFKMIKIMILKSNFHPKRARLLTESSFEKLKNTNFDFNQLEQEIIPYDVLWEYIILLLEIKMNNNKI